MRGTQTGEDRKAVQSVSSSWKAREAPTGPSNSGGAAESSAGTPGASALTVSITPAPPGGKPSGGRGGAGLDV
ncbi:hypothetical protein CYMTET_6987 [Cymbomonas tetramitiformis]|uniref:Uncharacterized protein n=1 Tax=Cymbomonas tetramitiformis TaxID=36881 RepID=A0AAE0GXU3_9CHLO|nr:hypothetical protein CYMTET_6987 [Cymbomonas tetramitiformis]